MSFEPQQLAHVGTCAILGLPNVGKSTLLNRLVGLRMMAVSPKPQTTRNRVVGVVNCELEDGKGQIVFVDTPGIQKGKGAFRRFMRDEALSAADDSDVALLLVDMGREDQRSIEGLRSSEARALLDSLEGFSGPVLLGLNKVDKLEDKSALFPILDNFAGCGLFSDLIPISAKKGTGVEDLQREIASHLKPGTQLFPEDMYTDRAERFLAGELIREQLFRQLGDELPYASAVVIESFQERDKGDILIHAAVHVERDSQKGIVVGKGGQRVRSVGEKARKAISDLFGVPVHLKLFVKVNPGWSQDQRRLRDLGYES